MQSASALSDEDLLRSSPLFDSFEYLRSYPDVAEVGFDPVIHYLQAGAAEGRDPSRSFSTTAYLRSNPDVAAEGANPLVHYLRSGIIEGRDVHSQDDASTLISSPNLDTRVSASFDESHRALLASTPLFDTAYYLASNADVAAAGLDSIEHYLTFGAGEGRDPSESFSTLGYLRRHADVAAAGLNPLVHYLEYGKAEGRVTVGAKPLVPSFAQFYEARWPHLKPLHVFHIPSGGPRLTIVTDSIGPASLFGGVGTALILGALVANRLRAILRIATRHDKPDGRALASVLGNNGIVLENALELSHAPIDGSSPLSLSDTDLFLTTSWWTTRPVLGTVPRNRVAYLLQEDERMFYPFGDERLLCSETLDEPNLALAVNTRYLSEHLRTGPSPLQSLERDSVVFEPAFPGKPADARSPESTDKRKFFFYSRPNNARNLFWRGASAIASAIEDGILNPAKWEFFFVGKSTSQFTLPRAAKLNVIEGLSWSDYQVFVGKMDAALVLMDTPHPSYPPLDLASAGVAVLTNTHPGKSDLSSYSKNILMSEPTLPGLRDGLIRVAMLGEDDASREKNRRTDGICRDWKVALQSTVDWLAQRYRAASEELHVP